MNQEFSNVPVPSKKNNTILIVVAVIAVLLCCCCLLGVGVFAFFGPVVGSVSETIEQGLPYDEEFPFSEDFPYTDDEEWDFGLGGNVPGGGYGDDTLRFDTWINVSLTAAFANCTIPEDAAARTEIQVLQEPDSAGVWVEGWTVPCDGGAPKSFTITFTPSDGGGTDFSIQSDD